MSIPVTHEQRLLQRCERVLTAAEQSAGADVRLPILEAVASKFGGWPLAAFRDRFGAIANDDELAPFTTALIQRVRETHLAPALAIAALGRGAKSRHTQRAEGAFYTDFRLAQYVAQSATPLRKDSLILDPAAGSGALLAAALLSAACGSPKKLTALIATSVCAADLDADALRACRASLAALCDDVEAIAQAATRLRQLDTLLVGREAWSDIAPDGFDLIIGNPPWEKLKVSRHEFLVARGHPRHYGATYDEAIDEIALGEERQHTGDYAKQIASRYPTAAQGELDLYKAFVACSILLLRPEGRCSLIVPAGLIRSQGTEPLRHHLLTQCGTIETTVFENRARFFAIDTRFKFLVVRAQKGGPVRDVRILHATGDDRGVIVTDHARIDRTQLRRARPDLTIPEIRSDEEWEIVSHMHSVGSCLNDATSPFKSTIVREVDMTRDRIRFRARGGDGLLPLAEGRMVGQHRFGAKAYRSGTGRRAAWELLAPGLSVVEPQFFYPVDALPPDLLERVYAARVGFCDVTGQANERSIIVALAPAGVVCGNKVPTITFDQDSDGHLRSLFVAVANSLSFDWMARRVLTTSVNYFLLRSLPLPPIQPHSPVANRLVELVGLCAQWDAIKRPLTFEEIWNLAEWRAEIDAQVLVAWKLAPGRLKMMLRDFPLLDRRQPPLDGERFSTVTVDLVLAWAARVRGGHDDSSEGRWKMGRAAGACAYVASEFALKAGGSR